MDAAGEIDVDRPARRIGEPPRLRPRGAGRLGLEPVADDERQQVPRQAPPVAGARCRLVEGTVGSLAVVVVRRGVLEVVPLVERPDDRPRVQRQAVAAEDLELLLRPVAGPAEVGDRLAQPLGQSGRDEVGLGDVQPLDERVADDHDARRDRGRRDCGSRGDRAGGRTGKPAASPRPGAGAGRPRRTGAGPGGGPRGRRRGPGRAGCRDGSTAASAWRTRPGNRPCPRSPELQHGQARQQRRRAGRRTGRPAPSGRAARAGSTAPRRRDTRPGSARAGAPASGRGREGSRGSRARASPASRRRSRSAPSLAPRPHAEISSGRRRAVNADLRRVRCADLFGEGTRRRTVRTADPTKTPSLPARPLSSAPPSSGPNPRPARPALVRRRRPRCPPPPGRSPWARPRQSRRRPWRGWKRT